MQSLRGLQVVKHRCKECNSKIHYTTYKYGSGLCKHCAFLGKRNPNYGNPKLAGENNPMFGKRNSIYLRNYIMILILNYLIKLF